MPLGYVKKNVGSKLSQKQFKIKFEKELTRTMDDYHNLSDNELRTKYEYSKFGSFGEDFEFEFNNMLRWIFEKNKKVQGDKCYDDFKLFMKHAEDESNLMFNNYLNTALLKSKRIQIDSNLFPLILLTDNQIHYRNLPYDELFIDVSLEIEEGVIIEGILVENYDYDSVSLENREKMDRSLYYMGEPKQTYEKNIAIRYYYNDYNNLFETISSDELNIILKKVSADELNTNINKDEYNEFIDKKYDVASKKIFNLLFNILDMLNNNQVEKFSTNISQSKNNKRIKKGLEPLPTTTIKLSPNKELQEYIRKFNQDSRKIEHQFLVRGHFRYFKNKDIYSELYSKLYEDKLEDEYIVDETGLIKKWIKPHYKGSGIFLDKTTILKK